MLSLNNNFERVKEEIIIQRLKGLHEFAFGFKSSTINIRLTKKLDVYCIMLSFFIYIFIYFGDFKYLYFRYYAI
jgi:hypothetical protein